jgi:hypothetical protein
MLPIEGMAEKTGSRGRLPREQSGTTEDSRDERASDGLAAHRLLKASGRPPGSDR